MESFEEFLISEGFLSGLKSSFNRVKRVAKATQTIANLGGSSPRTKKRAAWSTKSTNKGASRNKQAIDREREIIAKIKAKIAPETAKLKASREKIKRLKSSWI